MKKIIIYGILPVLAALFSVNSEVNAQDPCANKFGKDSVKTTINLSLFQEKFDRKEYIASFPYWLYLFANAPCVQKRITYNGPFLVKTALADPAYKTRYSGLVDTLLLSYKERINLFGEENNVKGRWAYDLITYKPKQKTEALKLFKEAVQYDGNKSESFIIDSYIKLSTEEYIDKKINLDSLIAIYEKISGIIDYNKANSKDTTMTKRWVATENYSFGAFAPHFNCDKLIELKRDLYKANPNDIKVLKNIARLLEVNKCTDKDFYLELAETIYKLNPDADAAESLARAFKSKDRYTKSAYYYEQAIEKTKDNGKKADYYYNLATFAFKNGQYSTVRNYCQKALQNDGGMGKAYILIGDAYASSAGSCTDDKLGGKTVYWAAVDKYYKAKSVDGSVAETANSKISKFSHYFPGTEDCFFLGMKEGGSYTVGCWIGESTTIKCSNH